jgi:CRISPR/Cas system CMR-associated protein Cmr5 small subunit
MPLNQDRMHGPALDQERAQRSQWEQTSYATKIPTLVKANSLKVVVDHFGGDYVESTHG